MATKKDLVEAHAFSRRRLVTAFISGAPGGREVEPSRPGRTIVGGIALSVLLIAGAAIASVLSARTPADWQKPGIIQAQGGTSATYVILDPSDPELHPILNSTSAQLIFGADATSTTVSRDTLDKEVPGSTLGIYAAPPDLPRTDTMIYSGWTACTGSTLGIRLDVAETPDVRPGNGLGFTVKTSDEDGERYYVIAVGNPLNGTTGARAYPVPDIPSSDAMLSDLGLGSRQEAITVPVSWVALFPLGGSLAFESFGFDPKEKLPTELAAVPGARAGAFIDDGGGKGRVLTHDGILPLDEFSMAVYRQTLLPGKQRPPVELPTGTEVPTVSYTDRTYEAAGWPRTLPRTDPQYTQPCAVLDASEGEAPVVGLGVGPGDDATAAAVVDASFTSVRVQPGHGSFVYSGSFDQGVGGEAWVINSQGNAYRIIDQESIDLLRYDKLPAPVVPARWIDLFPEGVALSTSEALCPPGSPDGTPAADQTCARNGESPSESPSVVGAGAG